MRVMSGGGDCENHLDEEAANGPNRSLVLWT